MTLKKIKQNTKTFTANTIILIDAENTNNVETVQIEQHTDAVTPYIK